MFEHNELGMRDIRRVAVIGSGVAGLTAAWVLARSAADVTLYEAAPRLGGQAGPHRVVAGNGEILGVDTGFVIHHQRTSPTLLRLFAELGVPTQQSEMSMSVRCDGCGLEYAGALGPGGLFATPRSLVRGRYLRLLTEVRRFHRLARAELRPGHDTERTLGEFVRMSGFSDYFVTHFLVPLVATLWSCDPATALRYPAAHLFTFLDLHDMLTPFDSSTWRTVTGGSTGYVHAVVDRLDHVLLATPVRTVHRLPDAVVVRDDADEVQVFDAAVIATHPAQALRMLAEPTRAEREVLGAMPYSLSHTVLHTDTSVLPTAPRAHASWNYRLPSCTGRADRAQVSCDLTRMQRLEHTGERRFIVTRGDHDRVAPDTVLDRMVYEQPLCTPDSVAAQRRLGEIGSARVVFAGAYHGWGFHEDGAASGLRAAERLGARWVARAVTPLPAG